VEEKSKAAAKKSASVEAEEKLVAKETIEAIAAEQREINEAATKETKEEQQKRDEEALNNYAHLWTLTSWKNQ